MTAAMTTLTEWQDKYMTFVARVEEPIVEYVGKAVDAIADYVPERPDWTMLDRMPTMTELVENQLKFRKRVVDEQAAFVRKLMKATRPALVKLETKTPVKSAMTTKPTDTAARRRAAVRVA